MIIKIGEIIVRKLLVTLIILIGSASSFAQEALMLNYYKGNQITAEYLKINTSGEVFIGKRTCCPPRTNWNLKDSLSDSEKEILISYIEELSQGKIKEESHQGALGEEYVDISVVHEGEKVVVMKSNLDSLMVNESESTNDILSFLKAFLE